MMTTKLNDADTLIFICCNQKTTGKCCAVASSEEFLNYIRQKINLMRDSFQPGQKVKAVRTSCLGKCAYGPNILVHPDNIWYTFSSLADADEIVNEHLIKRKVVERLINEFP